MKLFLGILFTILTWSQVSLARPYTFIDKVYKIKKEKDKTTVSFYRVPTIYEVGKNQKSLLKKLENGRKKNKYLKVTVEPKTGEITLVSDL